MSLERDGSKQPPVITIDVVSARIIVYLYSLTVDT